MSKDISTWAKIGIVAFILVGSLGFGYMLEVHDELGNIVINCKAESNNFEDCKECCTNTNFENFSNTDIKCKQECLIFK